MHYIWKFKFKWFNFFSRFEINEIKICNVIVKVKFYWNNYISNITYEILNKYLKLS
jgi:hypothetical protein